MTDWEELVHKFYNKTGNWTEVTGNADPEFWLRRVRPQHLRELIKKMNPELIFYLF